MFYALGNWAKEDLKGKQRRIIELLIEENGEMLLADLAIDSQVSWHDPYSDQWNSIRRQLNLKLTAKRLPWRLNTKSKHATLTKIGQK
jgi:hypothetical protein